MFIDLKFTNEVKIFLNSEIRFKIIILLKTANNTMLVSD